MHDRCELVVADLAILVDVEFVNHRLRARKELLARLANVGLHRSFCWDAPAFSSAFLITALNTGDQRFLNGLIACTQLVVTENALHAVLACISSSVRFSPSSRAMWRMLRREMRPV